MLEWCIGYTHPITIREVDEPVTILTELTRAELFENVAYRGILYARPGVSIIRYDKHIFFEMRSPIV